LLIKIREKIDWRGPKIELLRRIRRLGRSKKFTVRDVKLLRKIVNQQKREGYTDFKAALYYFPGKSVEMIERKYNEKYRRGRKIKI
jgi:hypothetical protein